jgi:hypothetical protein
MESASYMENNKFMKKMKIALKMKIMNEEYTPKLFSEEQNSIKKKKFRNLKS